MVGCFYVEAVVLIRVVASGSGSSGGHDLRANEEGRKEEERHNRNRHWNRNRNETPTHLSSFGLKASRGQQHAVSIVDLDLDMPTSATTSPCPAIRDIMALEMGPAFRARWATLRSQRVSRFNAAVLLRA